MQYKSPYPDIEKYVPDGAEINRGAHGDSLLILASIEALSKKPPLQAWKGKWGSMSRREFLDMQNKNCPNCGAPYDYKYDKCPYCGTYYLDLTGIDFTDRHPVFLKLKTEQWFNGKLVPVYITQKTIPQLGTIEVSSKSKDIHNKYSDIISSVVESREARISVIFDNVPMDDGSLFKVQVIDIKGDYYG